MLVEAAEACRPGVHERRPYISERIDHGVDLGTGEQFRGRCVLQLRSCRDAFGLCLIDALDQGSGISPRLDGRLKSAQSRVSLGESGLHRFFRAGATASTVLRCDQRRDRLVDVLPREQGAANAAAPGASVRAVQR
ncbi:hypothetical protein ACTXG6_36870 [Pseudonocardia sp. Cha107L01]|uniref:hypothetical protein n=1 Tax=Pseudonocardia sp. Cha107L01 TaxID=3457576 RepID=UPI00403E6ECA